MFDFQKDTFLQIVKHFYEIYASSPLDVYLAAFSETNFRKTLFQLVESLLAQEKTAKKKIAGHNFNSDQPKDSGKK